jgi:hypothetical protein
MLTLVRILHVGVAAAWFGHKLLIPADISRSLSDERQTARSLLPRLERAERLGIVTGVGTLATGALLVGMIGPDLVGVGVWVGLILVLVAIGTGAIVARPASIRLRAAVRSGDLHSARRAGRRLSQVLTVESVLWSASLIAMLA